MVQTAILLTTLYKVFAIDDDAVDWTFWVCCRTSVTTRHDAMTTKPTLNSSKINRDSTRQPSLEHIDIAEGLV